MLNMAQSQLTPAQTTVSGVYQEASNLFSSIRRRLRDIDAIWDSYHNQGLVPATSVIKDLQIEVKRQQRFLRNQKRVLLRRIARVESLLYDPEAANPTCEDWLTRDRETGDELSQESGEDVDNQSEKLALSDLKHLVFDSVRVYSEALTYLTQHINSRAATLAAAEATHGSTLTMHRFSGVQSIYDGAEAIMGDYASSFGDTPYTGLVIFGYNYQASVWKNGLTTFPLFAEHPNHLPMLIMLAHEASHWLQKEPALEDFRCAIEQRLHLLTTTRPSILPLLGPVSVDAYSRFHAKDLCHRRLAGEIVSDILATLIAGPSYARLLTRYFLPLHADFVIPSNRDETDDLTWSFYFISLKLRIAVETAELVGYMDVTEADSIRRYVQTIECTMSDVGSLYSTGTPDNPVLRAALRVALHLRQTPDGQKTTSDSDSSRASDPFTNTRSILNEVSATIAPMVKELIFGSKVRVVNEEELSSTAHLAPDASDVDLESNIIELLSACKVKPMVFYAPFNDVGALHALESEVSNYFSGEQGSVPLEMALKVWSNQPHWRPRHLIAALVPPFGQQIKENINTFAITTALAHHQLILSRYRSIKLSPRS
jgi:hypothetical protein